ncbi:MAG: hypothetical protein WA188_17450 [Terriglobales bacterium]
MKSRKTWRTGLLLVLMAGLLTVSELKGAPRVTVQNPTALYLLAEYKLAMGDAGSGLELLDRALAGRESLPSRPNTLNACNISAAVATP